MTFLKKDSLQKFVDALDNSNATFAYSKFKFGWKKFPCGEFNIEKLKQNNYISGNSIIRREFFPLQEGGQAGWDESLKKFQDWDLWLTIVEKGGKGIFIPEYLWKCKAGGTISSWLPGVKFNFYKFFKNNKKVLEFEKAKEIIKKKHGPFV